MWTKFWRDLLSGKDLDICFTFLLVLAYFLLSGLEQLEYIEAESAGQFAQKLMVALFGAMALISLKARHVYADVKDKIYKKDNHFSDKFAVNLLEEAFSSEEITIVANTLDLPELDGYEAAFQKILQGEIDIKVLLINPEGIAGDIASQRGLYEDAVSFKNRVNNNLKVLETINALSKNKIEIKVIDNPLSYFAVKFTTSPKSRQNNTICIAHYPFKTEQVREPKHTIREGYDSYYAVFSSEIDNLWKAGHVWKGSTKMAG